MTVETVVVGYLETNCYILTGDSSADALIIDPGANLSRIVGFVEKRGLKPVRILITHGHNDHIGALNGVLHKYEIPVFINEKEADFIHIPPSERRRYTPDVSGPGIYMLRDGDEITFGSVRLKALDTPGHTPGGMCYLADGVCFTGDTLFNDGVGRTDFDGGDYDSLMKSIRTKLLVLGDSTVIHPGHGPSSTIGTERRYF